MVMFMTHDLGMIRINIHEAKTHLSRYLAKLRAGQSIIVCNRNVPVAELRPLPGRREGKRPVGLARGTFAVPPEFFEPLPEEELGAWEGRGG
jgi:antitoxin (DNA-binding transcriptional repressor) of toxin-antitoxin stability system